jgi:nitrate reductase NapAB chaperone NapD
MKSVDLAIFTAVMAMKLLLVTDAEKKTRCFCVESLKSITNLKNIICDQMAMRSVDMSKRLGNTDQSQPAHKLLN